jgi:TetR/AcrR family transcriptional repressor of nem operon
MTSPRRIGAETSETRSTLLDSTERLMLEEGYAAVTYRRVASTAGVTAPLVQYYFPTLDDLFLALLRRRSDRNQERLKEALEANPEAPLRVIWDYSADETSAALMVELMALGNHRKAIQAEIAEVTRRSRKMQLDALSATHQNGKLAGEDIPNPVILFLLAGLDIVKQYLDWAEPSKPKTRSRKKASKSTGRRMSASPSNRSSTRDVELGRKRDKPKTGRSTAKSV